MNQQEEIIWPEWVGEILIKKSGKPFKSGLIVGIAKEHTTNPYSDKPAFKMDDGSIVDCYQLELYNCG